jgi:hypothetical protein
VVRRRTWYPRPGLVPGCARPSDDLDWNEGAIAVSLGQGLPF